MSGWSKTFILLSGILYAFVGVYCFFQPIGALIGLAWSIGFLVLTSGIFGVIAYIQIPKEERVIWGLLVCLTDIIFGMLVLTFNGTMILSALLPLFFAVTFIIRGIFTLIHSRDFDALITHSAVPHPLHHANPAWYRSSCISAGRRAYDGLFLWHRLSLCRFCQDFSVERFA